MGHDPYPGKAFYWQKLLHSAQGPIHELPTKLKLEPAGPNARLTAARISRRHRRCAADTPELQAGRGPADAGVCGGKE